MSGIDVEAHLAATSLHDRYAWAVHREDGAALAALFEAGGSILLTDEDTAFGVTGSVSDVLSHWTHRQPGTQMWNSQLLVDRRGPDEVRVDSFVLVPTVSEAIDEGHAASHLALLGSCADVLVRRDGRWLFASRTLSSRSAIRSPVRPGADEDGPDSADREQAARLQVEDLFADYAWTLDTGDIEGMAALFTASATLEDPVGHGGGSVKAFLRSLFAEPDFPGRIHWVGPSDLRVGEESAQGRSMGLVLQRQPRSGVCHPHLVIDYEDLLVNLDGGWLFERRDVDPDVPRYPAVDDGQGASGSSETR